MRFSAPRSISPSPVRGHSRRGYAFGLQTDSSDEEDSDADSSADSSSDTSYDTSDDLSDSDSDLPSYMKPRSPNSKVDEAEMRHIEETIAAIKLRVRHHDPYEEWEKEARKDAYKTARKEVTIEESKWEEQQEALRAKEAKRLADLHAKQMTEVQARLNAFQMQQKRQEEQLREGWKKRDQDLWSQVESVIKVEEEKVRKKLEEEQRKRDEEEKKRKEEELKRRLEEEKRKAEEERKRKEEEERKKEEEEQKRKEEEEKQRAEEERKERQAKEAKEAEQRKQLGASTAEEDWQEARKALLELKNQFTRPIKADKPMKSEWSKWRRQITPKIGQMTDDPKEINRISTELLHIMNHNPPHHPAIYRALLSSLSKAIIEQAETEVTAEKRSAAHIAQATWNLLTVLPGFAEVLWAKLVQRVGGWAVPCTIPGDADFDGRKWAPGERQKVMGQRESQNKDGKMVLENAAEYTVRVAGIMRVYFGILRCSAAGMGGKTLEKDMKMFLLPRYWMWFARMLGSRAMLGSGVAAQLIYTALDVMGSDAVQVWGMQWYKMLQLIYEGVTDGYEEGKRIGGDSPEGKAAQVRIQMEIERIVSGG